MDVDKFAFPIMVFKDGDKNLYSYLKRSSFGIVSKGGEKFYKDLMIIDSNGDVFTLVESRILKGASFATCLKYLQKMWEMELKIEANGTISFTDTKTRIIDHVSKNSKHWLAFDTLDGIREKVNATQTFRELFTLFK